MIQISKEEAFKMRELCGNSQVKYTFNKRHRHYYLVENPKNLKILKKYRDSITLFSSDDNVDKTNNN